MACSTGAVGNLGRKLRRRLQRTTLSNRLAAAQARFTAQMASMTVPETVTGLAGYAASYTPSLLPRPWYFQGLVAGLGAMCGYQVGLVGSWAISEIASRAGLKLKIKPGLQFGGHLSGTALTLIGCVAIPLASIRQQRNTARMVNASGAPNAFWAVASGGAGLGVFWLLMAQWRLTRSIINAITSHLHTRYSWGLLGRLVATFVTLATEAVILDQVIMRGVVGVATTASAQVDSRTPPNIHQPSTPLHSGSAESLESWDKLGLQGKRFTCCGPGPAQILEAMGPGPVHQPIRAYASMNGRSLAQVVAAVLAEIDRMDGWSRSNLLIVTTTGRGNVNEWSASAFEYLVRGDCTTIAMQYSTLPSVLTMISSKAQPVDASQQLLTAIEQRLAGLPAASRPRLFVAGESLGGFGSCSAFQSVSHLLERIDGAVWTGTPAFTPLHQELVASREPGSPYTMPVIDRGRHIRFAGRLANLDTDWQGRRLGQWPTPRFVLLQNETDPVVYWSPKLLWHRPEWLVRPPKNNPMAQMTWWPFITFWQITADMPVCRSLGVGYGHKYGAAQVIPGWAAVLGVDLDEAGRQRLQAALQKYVAPIAP